jgi:tRNA(fMet)-specific endonuclease VapC
MGLYLFDTDTCSYIMKRSHPVLLERIRRVPLQEQAVSVVTVAELLYGARLSADPTRARQAFDVFIRHLAVHEWTKEAAEDYAEIRADLRKRGQMIGANDLLIAAHALCLDAILVTNNVREFGRVRGLQVENWSE